MLSIVIPAYNEEDNLPVLYKKIIDVLHKEKIGYELLFFNDGSTDKTVQVMQKIAHKDSHARILSFAVNRGKSEALNIAFTQAKGDMIMTMDADLQDNPNDIPKFIAKMNEGYDMVAGWRKNRKDKSYMVIPSRIWNAMTRIFWKLTIHDYNCGFKLYTAEAARSLRLYGGMHRFIPMMLQQQGYRISEVVVDHKPRLYGKSKYGFIKIFKDWPDMFTVLFVSKFIKRPMHFFGFTGTLVLFIGLIMLSYLTILHYAYHQTVGDRPILIIGVLFVIVGLQTIFTGLIADMMVYMDQNAARHMTTFREIAPVKKH